MYQTIERLQAVFVQFKGAMVISLMAGLIDEETATLYYINAEHPFAVLRRSGKVEYLERTIGLYKLGSQLPGDQPGLEGPGLNPAVRGLYPVFVARLEAGDEIYIGSDGRVDIKLYAEGGATINDNDSLFLEVVQSLPPGAPLENVYRSIRRRGVLTDDLSLIRIRVDAGFDRKEKPPPALGDRLKEAPGQAGMNAAGAAAQLAEADPENAGLVYQAALLFWQAGRPKEAVDWAFRYHRRLPEAVDGIRLLAFCLRESGEEETATGFIALGRALAPNDDWERFSLPQSS